MKTLAAYLLFVAFSLQVFGSIITISAYEINKDFIAKNLCVNRNNRKSHCRGKCHLMKELQKEEKKDDASGNSAKDQNDAVQFFESTVENKLTEITQILSFDFLYIESKTNQHSSSVFHPPLG